MNFRKERAEDVIELELSQIIARELEFPNTLVTITAVRVNKKLDRADINFSIIPSEKSGEILEILNKEKVNLRNLLKKKVKMKFMPQLQFEIDHGPEDAAHIEKLLLEEDKID